METATLGGGCFWCVEAVMERLRGVSSVVSGYAGGHVEYPTYDEVCGKQTGHAEVVRVTFDPAVLSYDDLLRVFFTTHDPTTKDRQGNDVGPQYRSVVFTESDAQAEAAVRVRDEIEALGVWDRPLVTEIAPLDVFYEAEAYHQDYYRRNPFNGYCSAVIAPKVAKLRKQYAHLLEG
ncbi:MAG: peptide-methionine (S)-S-oxide reductase MsrA [Rhodothermales bacterium]|nr:peptide-methionine (S)-S-oxide reductase MsrA [Rhodothermales bacterium]MCA0267820.1 peptide-methionine (S)-S-oxide reductase MsrA [Bacteroidota bacterium]